MAVDGGNGTPGSSLSVGPEEVRRLGRYIYEQAQTLRSALNSNDREIAGLMSDGWSGPTATAFTSGWSECKDGGYKIFDTLTELAANLGITASSYIDSDTRSAGNISSLNL